MMGRGHDKHPRTPLQPDERTLHGRIDLMLQRLGKTRPQLTDALGLSTGYIGVLARGNHGMRPERIEAAAKFLGCDPAWLANGGSNVELAPVTKVTKVTKANGVAHHAATSSASKIVAAMNADADASMAVVWGMIDAPDVKLRLIAAALELIGQRQRR
jgi:transcriptional regulator with XRE-family HTH domain